MLVTRFLRNLWDRNLGFFVVVVDDRNIGALWWIRCCGWVLRRLGRRNGRSLMYGPTSTRLIVTFATEYRIRRCTKRQNPKKKFEFSVGKYFYYVYLYWWSIWAFSILLSLALRFWNQILIWVSVRSKFSANSNLRGREMYSFLWYSISSLRVWSEVKVVLWRRCRASFRLLLATKNKTDNWHYPIIHVVWGQTLKL